MDAITDRLCKERKQEIFDFVMNNCPSEQDVRWVLNQFHEDHASPLLEPEGYQADLMRNTIIKLCENFLSESKLMTECHKCETLFGNIDEYRAHVKVCTGKPSNGESTMSIEAIVDQVYHGENGNGRMILKPPTNGDNPGQTELHWDSDGPHDVTALNGCLIWGGASSIMLGEIEIAKRDGYTKIVWTVKEIGSLANGRQVHPFATGSAQCHANQ